MPWQKSHRKKFSYEVLLVGPSTLFVEGFFIILIIIILKFI